MNSAEKPWRSNHDTRGLTWLWRARLSRRIGRSTRSGLLDLRASMENFRHLIMSWQTHWRRRDFLLKPLKFLQDSFDWKEGLIETRLAGRTAARANSFADLLAPERRGSIFQSVAADNDRSAKVLKDLLVFTVLSNQDQKGGSIDEKSVVAAAKEFASGNDPAQVHRQLYAASRLLQKGIGFSTAHELAEAARNTADAGLTVPEATLAVQADEYREIRARAIAAGGTPNIVEAPRNILSNLLRGRIEDISGWALFNQDKAEEALDHLRRAANILPERTPVWRTSLWHLGAALERLDRGDEALVYYIKSYSVGDPDPARRTVIERVYRKKHGSLTGLDEQIGAVLSGIPTQVEASSVADKSSAPAQSSSPEVTPNATPVSSEPARTESAPPSAQETKPSPEPSTPAPRSRAGTRHELSREALNPLSLKAFRSRAPTIVTIKGRVVDSANNPIANVVVVLISPQGTVLGVYDRRAGCLFIQSGAVEPKLSTNPLEGRVQV